MNPKFLAKTILNLAVATKAASMAKDVLIDHTSIDPDRTAVKVGEHVAIMGIATVTAPVTDRAVDVVWAKTAQFKNRNNETE